jgi:serine/threonine-protein kinase
MLKARQKLGKYRIDGRLADGQFATVYRAFDTIEGIPVALKIPHGYLMDNEFLEDFRKEVRLAAKLDHSNILPVKNASFIDRRFVIVFPLGKQTLADRLSSRMSIKTALNYAEQMLEAVAHAHRHRIIHCDIKPENLIIFAGNRLRLTDFGIAKVALWTQEGSGSGTIGYMAPEQAMGRPTHQSDVFSLGLIIYRMLSGQLPVWPYEWPPPGFERIRKRLHPDLIAFLRKSLEHKPARRYRDADQMLAAFHRVKSRAVGYASRKRRGKKKAKGKDWQEIRLKQFRRRYGKLLKTHFECRRCGGPVSELMSACPWCKATRAVHRDETSFPKRCPRCKRGIKLDWRFCPWCYGPGLRRVSEREYSDVRYDGRCSNPGCSRKVLMPFMHYCPWCRRKVRKKWKIDSAGEACPSCGWGVLKAYWSYCPWCNRKLQK